MTDGEISVSALGQQLLDITVGKLGGLADGFVSYLPQEIATALGGGTLFGTGGLLDSLPGLGSGLDLGSLLNFDSLLGGLDLSNLLPADLFGGLGSLGDMLGYAVNIPQLLLAMLLGA